MSDIARQRARQIAGELANILTNEMFGDYGTDWTWDELCLFIEKLRTLAQTRGVPVRFELKDKPFPKLLNAHAIMQEHIEKYHKPTKKLPDTCRECVNILAREAVREARKEV